MSDNPENLVLFTVDSPDRELWIDTLFGLMTPPSECIPDYAKEGIVQQFVFNRDNCEVACDLYGTKFSPMDVFTQWDELSYPIHLNQIHRMRDFVDLIDTSEFTEEELRAHQKTIDIMRHVVDCAENGPENCEEPPWLKDEDLPE